MDFERETDVVVRSFHYDLNEEPKIKDEVNVAFRKAAKQNEDGTTDDGGDSSYFEVAVQFEVAPAPGEFTVSGQISQIVKLENYRGDGQDLSSDDYKLLSRPLVEYIETLTYEVTQITLDQPVNLNFKANF
ncbi:MULTISPECIES: DUF1149 family protein [Lactobacillus]|uniref:DUF1149 family protein n=1 Tax=Lactobacillus xujianguonis TaxID=2495899 RepID=A0A437SSQ7_9LACO|nr:MULTISPECIES: DUF1149 family protein [Lactobacillus]RVU69925.1 DUF1149 family protein [Lactobacillus xujianguonis]RVU72322.1 DUF1149 family protein [Lactobacillus xujianguonis]